MFARMLAPSLFLSKKYKAILCADFFPTPGSIVNALTNSVTKSLNHFILLVSLFFNLSIKFIHEFFYILIFVI